MEHKITDGIQGSEIVDFAVESGNGARLGAGLAWQECHQDDMHEPVLGADRFYDAGQKHCAYGPLNTIAELMRQIEPGGTLEVRAEAPSVVNDLPSWCRLAGYELTAGDGGRFLIRKS